MDRTCVGEGEHESGGTGAEHSAGGVVVRGRGQQAEFLAIKPAGQERWQLPKGNIDSGETPEQAAIREVREEGGVDVSLEGHLQRISYFYRAAERRVSKTVDFFLMRFVGGDHANHDAEVDEARWFPFADYSTLTFPSERQVVQAAGRMLDDVTA